MCFVIYYFIIEHYYSMSSFGKLILENKKDFSFESPTITNEKYVVISNIGFPNSGKSTFANCLISYIAGIDAKVFSIRNNNMHHTNGIDYIRLKISPNANILMLDSEGLSTHNLSMLSVIYSVSNLIILNVVEYCEIEKVIGMINNLKKIIEPTIKPKLIIRVLDYSSEVPIINTLKNFYGSNYSEIFSNVYNYFSEIDIISTEQLGKLGRFYMQEKKYFSIVENEDIGFKSECEKIFNIVNGIIPTNAENLNNVFDEIMELITEKKLKTYQENFNVSTLSIKKTISEIKKTHDETVKLFEKNKYKTIFNNYNNLLLKLDAESNDFLEKYSNSFELSDVDDILKEISENRKDLFTKFIDVTNESDKFVFGMRHNFLNKLFSQFQKIKIHGSHIYEFNFDQEKNNQLINKELILKLANNFDVLYPSVQKLVIGFQESFESIKHNINKKCKEQTNAKKSLLEYIDKQFEKYNVEKYITDQIKKINNIKIPNKNFKTFFSNIVIELENEIIKYVEDELPSYELCSYTFKNNESYEIDINFVIYCEKFNNSYHVENYEFSEFEEKIYSYVNEIYKLEEYYETIYNDHIVNTYEGNINENTIILNPNITFAKIMFHMNLTDINVFRDILNKNDLNIFANNLPKNIYQDITTMYFSKSIENMFKKLCKWINLSYKFVIDNIYTNNAQTHQFSNNLISFKFDTIENKLHQKFFNMLMDKYMETYKLTTSGRNIENNLFDSNYGYVLGSMITQKLQEKTQKKIESNNKLFNKMSFFDY